MPPTLPPSALDLAGQPALPPLSGQLPPAQACGYADRCCWEQPGLLWSGLEWTARQEAENTCGGPQTDNGPCRNGTSSLTTVQTGSHLLCTGHLLELALQNGPQAHRGCARPSDGAGAPWQAAGLTAGARPPEESSFAEREEKDPPG